MDVLARIRHAIGISSLPEVSDRQASALAEATTAGSDAAAAASQSTITATQASGSTTPQRASGHVASLSSAVRGAGRKRRRGDISPALAFRDNWLVIRSLLTAPDQAALHHGIGRTDLAVRLQELRDSLVFEANRADEDVDIAGPCMEMLLEGDVLGQLVRWTANDRIAGSQAEVVHLFASLIILLDERFLSRQAVHRPLVRLMRICVGDEFFPSTVGGPSTEQDLSAETVSAPHEDEEKRAHRRFGRMGSAEMLGFEEHLVDMMCHVASRLRNTPELLIIFFRERGGDEQTRRAFNIAMTGSSGTPSRISTRAPSPTGSTGASPGLSNSNVGALNALRTSAPLVSSPLRPPDSLPLPASLASLSPGLSNKGGDATSQTSSVSGLSYDFPLFSYLMRFVHRESRTGELARAGILFLVDVAFAPGRRNLSRGRPFNGGKAGGSFGRSSGVATRSLRNSVGGGRRSGTSTPQKSRIDADLGIGPSIALARFMLESDFAEVLGAGVGAVYGLLPTKLAFKKSQLIGDLAKKGGMRVGQEDSLGGPGEGGDAHAATSGLASSNSDEVRGQTRLLCDLLEFTQDILRTTSRVAHTSINGVAAGGGAVGLGLDEGKPTPPLLPPTSVELASIARSLTVSVTSALQTLFLESILYPSMLECSDLDFSSVAVLSYLEAVLSVLETDSPLADCIVGWLVGRESDSSSSATPSSADRRNKVNESSRTMTKRKSTAMLQLERERGSASSRQNASYFNDVLGRYTIRDLIVDNSQPISVPMAAVAALRLATTLFSFHGRFTLRNVIRVDVDDFATAFPTNLFSSSVRRESDDDLASNDSNDTNEQDDHFVYPGTVIDAERSHQRLKKLARKAVGGRSALQFQDEMDAHISLIAKIERGKGNQRSMAADASTLSTGFDKYLDDAEMGIMRDSMFGITMRIFETDDEDDDAVSNNKNGFAAITMSDAHHHLQDVNARLLHECTRHKLNSQDRLLRTILASLCHFWQNRPEVNVALTGFIATLAMCPLRSLEGFLTSSRLEAEQEFIVSSGANGHNITISAQSHEEEDDDRSDDEREFARKMHAARRMSRKTANKHISTAFSTQLPIVTSILRALVVQLDRQRKRVVDFDKVLSERRRGLLYVENLDEALKLSALMEGDKGEDGDEAPTPYNVYAPRSSMIIGKDDDVDPQVELIEEPPTDAEDAARKLSLPPPPSATPSQGMQHGGEQGNLANAIADTAKPSAPERSGFARFFGRAPTMANKATSNDTSKAVSASAPVTHAPAPMPFAHHYIQTASVFLDFGTLRLSSACPWSSSYDADKADQQAKVESVQSSDGSPVAPITTALETTRKRTRFRDAAAGSDSEAEETYTYPGLDNGKDEDNATKSKKSMYGKKKQSNRMGTPSNRLRASSAVSMSAVLDNAVVLEEFIKEIVAILQVRRATGIDAVRFV